MYGFNYYFQRLGDKYPDATLFGEDNVPKFSDVEGQIWDNQSYILSAMAAMSEYPELAKSIFLTKEKNDKGIYAVKFFIRGKPWIVTVDDNVMMYQNAPNFALIGDNSALWVPILQKAWSKVKGSYADANLGF